MARQPDVVIIGGGAIGCSAAYYLRSEGLQVALVDKGPVGREASWASAGIIGPSSHPRGDPWFRQATLLSRQLYDELNGALFEETGRCMGYGGRGSMTLALSPAEAAEATADAEREAAAGVALEVLTGAEARRREPALPQNLEAVILHPEGRFLDARNYTATIARAAQLKGVKMRPGWPVTALLRDGSRVTGVRSGPEWLGAGWVINASGAWAGILDSKLTAPITPDHGQIMSLEGPATGLRHTLHRWGSYGYITPRPDGRVVVGATHEEIGFRQTNHAGRFELSGRGGGQGPSGAQGPGHAGHLDRAAAGHSRHLAHYRPGPPRRGRLSVGRRPFQLRHHAGAGHRESSGGSGPGPKAPHSPGQGGH